MNIVEALDLALPELPVQRLRQERYPRLDPGTIAREHVIMGDRRIYALPPGSKVFYHFSPAQWRLAQLFDGERSFADVAAEYQRQTGEAVEESFVRQFAASMEPFWYKTLQEKNLALNAKLIEARNRVKPKKTLRDFTRMPITAWDPEQYFSRIHPKLTWLYSRWFTVLTLIGFSFMIYVFISRWGEIWRDTFQYYNFSQKGLADIAEFWVMFLIMAYIHESSHGLTCKHYGGEVHQMGFMLIYLVPIFFVNVVQAWVYANRVQRLITIIAGIWSELIVCTIATVVYWGTPAGTLAHDLAYKFMLITGIAVVLMNLNPLLKLDGYYLLTELVGMPALKEESTEYVSNALRKYIFRLPVEVPWLPPRRRVFFISYALLSGLYSYSMLFVVVRLLYNVCHSYSPDWAFLPALWLAYKIFHSRLVKLMAFIKTVYLDKKDRVRAWLTPLRLAAVVVIAAVVGFTPIFRRTVDARFVVEPAQRAVVRALVTGTVQDVYVGEGEHIAAGAPLVRLTNLRMQGDAANAAAQWQLAVARDTEAQMRYADYAKTERQRALLAEHARLTSDEVSKLNVTSPIAGVVVTPRVRDLLGSRVEAGTVLAEIDDLSALHARIYVPEFDMRYVALHAGVSLRIDGTFGTHDGVLSSITTAPSAIESGLVPEEKLKGLIAPQYYVGKVVLNAPEPALKPGMSGTAKIRGERRSLAQVLWEPARDFVQRKLW